jgi:prolipoprotein diacylglyceryltransferase
MTRLLKSRTGVLGVLFPVQAPRVMLHGAMPVFPLFLYEGLSEGSKGLFASILLPVTINKRLQCVLKVSL